MWQVQRKQPTLSVAMPRGGPKPKTVFMSAGVALAASEAAKSAETFRLGAVLLYKNKVVAHGRNRNINTRGSWSVHAEMDVVRKAPARWKARARHLHLVVVRVLRDGTTTGCSKPCTACSQLLSRLGISKVTYTTGDPHTPLASLTL